MPSLWLHQGEILDAYAERFVDEPDVALELPTGTGKTLIGLLVAEWRRRQSGRAIVYAAPTRQLARQAWDTANTEGISARLLIGSHRDWSAPDPMDVTAGDAIAITTYNSIFNSSPKLPHPHVVLFDDAHAADQYVGDQYAVNITRRSHPLEYMVALDALRPFISGLHYQRLRGSGDAGAHHQVRLIVPALNSEALEAFDEALAGLGEPFKFNFAQIRSGLSSCNVYLSYSGILIRPVIPPTFENALFTKAQQRVYLSATLGSSGELERAFARSPIARLSVSPSAAPRQGRRFFVFPDLVAGADANSATRALVSITDKALLLSQGSSEETEASARSLLAPDHPVFDRRDVEHGLGEFKKASTGILALANRYDGMDLPDDSCRIVILQGKLDSTSLQERFLGQRAQADAAIAERLRTRIIQGAGRCTRGPNDFALVIVLDAALTRYFARPENKQALQRELQGEVEFGWLNSKGQDEAALVDLARTFLEQGEEWREHGEPRVEEFRDLSAVVTAPGSEALGESAGAEVLAWRAAFVHDWSAASAHIADAAKLVGNGGEATRGYRAFLLYLAAVWLHLASPSPASRAAARQLARNAQSATPDATWLKEMPALVGSDGTEETAHDGIAINEIAARLEGRFKASKLRARLSEMIEQLNQVDAVPYETGLTTLGHFLGASARKPAGDGRCDSAWLWGSALWVTVEAKSEEHPDGLLPLRDIRQTNTQMDQLSADEDTAHAPPGSPSIVVTDRLSVDPQHAATANPNVYVCSTSAVAALSSDVQAVWNELLASGGEGVPAAALKQRVRETLTEFGCLPSQVAERLRELRVRPEE